MTFMDNATNHDVDPVALADNLGRLLSQISQGDASINTPGPVSNQQDLLSAASTSSPTASTTPITPTQSATTQDALSALGSNTTDGEANPVGGSAPINQGFGGASGHPGIDIGVPVGTTLIAAINGKVTAASDQGGGYGNLVEITGANGIAVRYGHLSAIGVKVGQSIRAGEVVGKSGGIQGAPGAGNSTGPHLHFEVDKDGTPIDPSHFLAVKGNGVVAGTPGDAAPVDAAAGSTVTPENATATAVSRVSGVLSGQGDPGSENTPTPTADASAIPGSGDTGNVTNSVNTPQNMGQYFTEVLKGIGAPVTDANMAFLSAWMRAEGGSADNPFNTTQSMPGDRTINSDGVRRYADVASGLRATISTLMQSNMAGIRQALLSGTNSLGAAHALAASPWGTGGLVTQILEG